MILKTCAGFLAFIPFPVLKKFAAAKNFDEKNAKLIWSQL